MLSVWVPNSAMDNSPILVRSSIVSGELKFTLAIMSSVLVMIPYSHYAMGSSSTKDLIGIE
jgi:hypothetical protein